MLLQEPSPIVQLSYSWEALLISSEKRTVLWDFHNEKATQVGQKERKRSKNCCFVIFVISRLSSSKKLLILIATQNVERENKKGHFLINCFH